MIQDPGFGLATRAQRRNARLAVWVPWWTSATAQQKKDLLWDYFVDWVGGLDPRSKVKLVSKVRVLMDDPDATFQEMKVFVQDRLTVRILRGAIAWLS